MFYQVFFGILAAALASQIIGWLVFYIWWTEPHKKIKRRIKNWLVDSNEPKPQATYRDQDWFEDLNDYREKHDA